MRNHNYAYRYYTESGKKSVIHAANIEEAKNKVIRKCIKRGETALTVERIFSGNAAKFHKKKNKQNFTNFVKGVMRINARYNFA